MAGWIAFSFDYSNIRLVGKVVDRGTESDLMNRYSSKGNDRGTRLWIQLMMGQNHDRMISWWKPWQAIKKPIAMIYVHAYT